MAWQLYVKEKTTGVVLSGPIDFHDFIFADPANPADRDFIWLFHGVIMAGHNSPDQRVDHSVFWPSLFIHALWGRVLLASNQLFYRRMAGRAYL